jgi:hypothetical protein
MGDAESHAVAADRAASVMGDRLGRIEPHAAGAVSVQMVFPLFGRIIESLSN